MGPARVLLVAVGCALVSCDGGGDTAGLEGTVSSIAATSPASGTSSSSVTVAGTAATTQMPRTSTSVTSTAVETSGATVPAMQATTTVTTPTTAPATTALPTSVPPTTVTGAPPPTISGDQSELRAFLVGQFEMTGYPQADAECLADVLTEPGQDPLAVLDDPETFATLAATRCGVTLR